MKRGNLYIIYVLAMAIFATSCSKDKAIEDGVYLDVEISTAIETNYSDEEYSRTTSGFGVNDEIYDMRYTIELWSDDYPDAAIYCAEDVVSESLYNLSHSFRAVAGEYRLVIFADYVKTSDNDEVSESHYDTSKGLDEIMMKNNSYTANDLSRDCYGYSEELIITSSFSLSGIELTRPMAKMTLADSNPSEIIEDSEVTISYGSTSLPCGYDLLNGDVITGEKVTVSYPKTEQDQTLAFDYIFISDATSYLMTFTVYDKEVSTIVPFEQNKTTNITATFFGTQTE